MSEDSGLRFVRPSPNPDNDFALIREAFSKPASLISAGGLSAPVGDPYPEFFVETHSEPRWAKPFLRLLGQPTSWREVVYLGPHVSIRELLPTFRAAPGGITFVEGGIVRDSALSSRYDWAMWAKPRGRLARWLRRRRERLALAIAPWLDEDRY